MSTPLERAQEIANRGLQDSLSEDKRRKFDQMIERNMITLPGVPGGQEFDVGPEKRELQLLMKQDPDFSQEGVKNKALRAGLSRMDTPEEREAFLKKAVGEKGFTKDRFGNLALTPEGAKGIGQETDKPVVIDEPGLSTGDIADLRGVAPVIAGGIAGGFASTGMGIPAAAGVTALTAAGFKGVDEAADALRGENIQTGTEVAKDLAKEGALAATGEVVFRGILAPIGRKLLEPNASVLREGGKELAQEAADIGVKPKLGNLVNRPILTRMTGLVDTIFGDLSAAKNAKAIGVRIKSLRNAFGKHVDDTLDLGTRIKADIGEARKAFGEAANVKFGVVDKIAKGKKLISTSEIKAQAKELLDALPKEAKTKTIPAGDIVDASGNPLTPASTKQVDGRSLLTSSERVRDLKDIGLLPDNITTEQLQGIRNTLFDRMEFGSVTPGIGSREARLLVKSVEGTLDDAITSLSKSIDPDDVLGAQALDALKDARTFYANGIKAFDNATIKRLVKDPSIAGSLDPERVVDLLFKKGSVSPLNRVLRLLPKETAGDIKSAAMNKVLDMALKESGDPLIGSIFDGTNLIKSLNSFGNPTLDAMFGVAKRKELYTLGRVIQSASKPKGGSGGLVAASIAVNPLANLGRLAKLRVIAHIFGSKNGIKWLTQGIAAPKTRTGVAALSRLNVQVRAASEGLTLGKKVQGTEE